MEIRNARAGDVDQVVTMVGRLIELHTQWDRSRFETKPTVLAGYKHWLSARADDASSVFLVATQNDQCVAFVIGTVEESIPIYRVTRFGYVHDLWVEPDYRNEGLAKSMTLLALERFKAIGVTQVRLETAMANDAARSLFAACGFRASTQEMLVEL